MYAKETKKKLTKNVKKGKFINYNSVKEFIIKVVNNRDFSVNFFRGIRKDV